MEKIIIAVYFALWLLLAIFLFVVSKFITDVKKKTKIKNVINIINAIGLLTVINILFRLWKAPILIRLFFNFLVLAFVVFFSKIQKKEIRGG